MYIYINIDCLNGVFCVNILMFNIKNNNYTFSII